MGGGWGGRVMLKYELLFVAAQVCVVSHVCVCVFHCVGPASSVDGSYSPFA